MRIASVIIGGCAVLMSGGASGFGLGGNKDRKGEPNT
jgi:hypothetical protein